MTASMSNTGTFMLSKEIDLLIRSARSSARAVQRPQFVSVWRAHPPERVATEAEISPESVNALPEDTSGPRSLHFDHPHVGEEMP